MGCCTRSRSRSPRISLGGRCSTAGSAARTRTASAARVAGGSSRSLRSTCPTRPPSYPIWPAGAASGCPGFRTDESIKVVPDRVCEIFSPSTRGYDQVVKQPFYAKHGVRWLWFIDPEACVLLAHRLENGRWVSLGTWGHDARARIEPFDAIELDLSNLWLPPED